MDEHSVNPNDLRMLAEKLQMLWYYLRVWREVVIAKQGNYRLYLDREGHLYLERPMDEGGNFSARLYLSVPGDDAEHQDFDRAIELTGCTAKHFQQAMDTIWRVHLKPVAYWYYFCGELRHRRYRVRRWFQRFGRTSSPT